MPLREGFTYRMPAGIPGYVNRFLGGVANITPEKQSASLPVLEYGVPVVVDQNGARRITAADTTDVVSGGGGGFSVRPYPGQDVTWGMSFNTTANPGFGPATPPAQGVLDVLRQGYMTVRLGGSTAAVKGGQVYVWSAASSGAHVQGRVEAGNPGGSGFAIARCRFRGPADADGNTEIEFY